MDDMANAFWILLAISIIGVVVVFAFFAILIGKHVSQKVVKKEDKYSALKRNLIITTSFYLLAVIYFFIKLGPWWANKFAFIFLPILSALLFLILEAIEAIKEKLHL